MGDNALLKLAPLLPAMGERQPGYDVTESSLRLLRDLGLDPEPDVAAALEGLRARDPLLAMLVEPQLGVTFAPTMVSRVGEDQRDPVAARGSASTAARRRGSARTSCAGASPRCSATSGYEVDFTEHTVGNSLARRSRR